MPDGPGGVGVKAQSTLVWGRAVLSLAEVQKPQLVKFRLKVPRRQLDCTKVHRPEFCGRLGCDAGKKFLLSAVRKTATYRTLRNSDGVLDLVVADRDAGYVSVLLGTVGGTFLAPTNYSTGFNNRMVKLADFNNDGNLDIAVTNQSSNNVSILLGNGGFGGTDELRGRFGALWLHRRRLQW